MHRPSYSPLSSSIASTQSATRTCLNGWWEFQPLPMMGPEDVPDQVPADGWEEQKILVPSFFTKAIDVSRQPGESQFSMEGKRPFQAFSKDTEFLFDAYGYPNKWTESPCGWHRRPLQIDTLPTKNERIHLLLEGVQPVGIPYFNGVRLESHPHPALPHRFDVTDLIKEGENELAVLCVNYPLAADGRPAVPTGNVWTVGKHGGIWQDCWLERRGAVNVAAVDIRTQDGNVSVIWTLSNATDGDLDITLAADLCTWKKEQEPLDGESLKAFPDQKIRIPAKSEIEVSAQIPDEGLERWSPQHPNLHWLRSTLKQEETTFEIHTERFGVRDLKMEGINLLLDGNPIHLFSDWGHKLTPYHHTEGWVRQWFGMIRDANMNHSRLHTHPHPRLILDLADEEGILITPETGILGSGNDLGADDPAFWDHARDHVKRLVARDRNHPSVILWSVENEMRWNWNQTDLFKTELPALQRLFRELDPTRQASHDGDSSLWDERNVDIISRHYGKECAGEGWWNRKQPLHSSEMSLHHFMGPNNTLHLGGDVVFADYAKVEEFASEDAARIIETGRSRGVGNWGPWNLSCLSNIRPETKCIKLEYDDYSAPGIKPLQAPPHSSEFSFWNPESKGYTPSPSFEGIKNAFRPLAVIDRSWRSQYRKGQTVNRTLTVVNDLPKVLSGTLTVTLDGKSLATEKLAIGQGRFESTDLSLTIPKDLAPGLYGYTVCFKADSGEQDQWTRTWRVADEFAHNRPLAGISLTVVGDKAPVDELEALGADVTKVSSLEESKGHSLVVVGRNVIQGTDEESSLLRSCLAKGARVLLLEQNHSVFPALELNPSPYATAWTRAPGHPLLENITDADLCFWGEAGYAALEGDHIVTQMAYTKADGRYALPIMDTGEGGFGTGNLGTQPLLEVEEGAGLLIASQFLTRGRYRDLPVAENLLVNAVRHLQNWNPATHKEAENVLFSIDSDPESVIEAARGGEEVLVEGLGSAADSHLIEKWSDALGVRLEWTAAAEKHWQAVYPQDEKPDDVFSGISLEDLCGIETWTYAKAGAVNHALAEGALCHADGLEALLVSPTKSGLYELMVHQGKTEPLRAHTTTRFVYGEERPAEQVLIARVRVGDGSVLLSCLQFPEDYDRLQRARNRLLANLGIEAEGSALEGVRINSHAVSRGFADVVKHASSHLDDAVWTEIASASGADIGDRCWTQPWSEITEFERLPADGASEEFEGHIPVPSFWKPGEAVIIGSTVSSPRARKDMSSDIGVPNPEEQLFCDFKGAGEVEAVLNGVEFGKLELKDGVATLPDLELLMGRNHLVLRWWPTATSDTLRIEFRDIMRRPETSFSYG